jgi:hypothetical protein
MHQIKVIIRISEITIFTDNQYNPLLSATSNVSYNKLEKSCIFFNNEYSHV